MASRKSKLDQEIAELYGGPLGEFTAARQALAKRLQKEGRTDDAAEVKALPKPSLSAWAVNRLFSREPEAMEELLDAGERARGALRDIFSGAHPEVLREAIQTARDLADDLRRRAAELLAEETGRLPGQAIVDRIGTNLQSLAFTPAAAAEAARGWLAGDLEPPGFEVLAGLQLAGAGRSRPEPRPEARPAPRPAPPKPEKPAAKDTERPHATARRRERLDAKSREKQEREEARLREQREREAEKERREREESRLRERVARAKADHDEIAGRADFLRRKAEQAEKAAEEAQRRADEAREAADQARERSKQADKELARARKELEKIRAEQGGQQPRQPKRKRPGG